MGCEVVIVGGGLYRNISAERGPRSRLGINVSGFDSSELPLLGTAGHTLARTGHGCGCGCEACGS